MKKLFLVLFVLLLVSCTNINMYKDLKVPGCDVINDTGVKDICYNNLAIKKWDKGMCLKIGNNDYQQHCLDLLSGKLGSQN